MKRNTSFILSCFAFVISACAASMNRADKIETNLVNADVVSGQTQVGVQRGEMVVQDQARASERLRDLQNEVFTLEDKVYGTRKLGSEGLYGQLRRCRRKLASKSFGGDGTLSWSEPLDRVTDKEEAVKLGLNERQQLVGVNKEYLRDRLTRFLGYKMILQKRADEFSEKVEACEAEVHARRPDPSQSEKVVERARPLDPNDQTLINTYVCGYARRGASLKDLMLTAFARGWRQLTDYRADQNLLAPEGRDQHQTPKANVMTIGTWTLAFDQPSVSLGELLGGTKDARLVSWTASGVKLPANVTATCLERGEGAWSP